MRRSHAQGGWAGGQPGLIWLACVAATGCTCLDASGSCPTHCLTPLSPTSALQERADASHFTLSNQQRVAVAGSPPREPPTMRRVASAGAWPVGQAVGWS